MKEYKFGIIINDEKLSDFLDSKEKLIIISGSSRGGTSLIAYALRKAGVEFGEVDKNNHEPRVLLDHKPTKDAIKSFISDLREGNKLVGVKFPAFVFELAWMDAELDNAIFIHVIRNHLDTATSIMKRSPKHSLNMKGLVVGIKHSAKFHRAFADAIPDMRKPVFVVSYEKIIANPVGFVESIRELGVDIADHHAKEIAEAIGTPGYKQV